MTAPEILTPTTIVEPLTDKQLAVLMASLNPSRVTHRKQGGSNLSYLQAYDVKATLIRVFGFGGFSAECIETDVFDIRQIGGEDSKKFAVSARCTVRLTIHQLGAVFTESAASSQTGSQGIGDVADFAIKTAESDALKRAATYLGTQFGLGLYNAGSTAEVVQSIFAPTQEYFRGVRQAPAPEQVNNAPMPQADEDGRRADDGEQQAPAQEAPQQEVPMALDPAYNGDPTTIRHPGTTDEQHAENQALLARAMNAKPINEDGSPQQ